jgi:hypothetical protein
MLRLRSAAFPPTCLQTRASSQVCPGTSFPFSRPAPVRADGMAEKNARVILLEDPSVACCSPLTYPQPLLLLLHYSTPSPLTVPSAPTGRSATGHQQATSAKCIVTTTERLTDACADASEPSDRALRWERSPPLAWLMSPVAAGVKIKHRGCS